MPLASGQTQIQIEEVNVAVEKLYQEPNEFGSHFPQENFFKFLLLFVGFFFTCVICLVYCVYHLQVQRSKSGSSAHPHYPSALVCASVPSNLDTGEVVPVIGEHSYYFDKFDQPKDRIFIFDFYLTSSPIIELLYYELKMVDPCCKSCQHSISTHRTTQFRKP